MSGKDESDKLDDTIQLRNPDLLSTARLSMGYLSFMIVLLVGLGASYYALSQGVADRLSAQAEDALNSAQDLSAAAASADLLREAIEWSPGHPGYLYRLGQWHRLLYQSGDRSAPHLALASQYLEASLEIRPHWPQVSSELAVVLVAQGQVGDRLYDSIDGATADGPWTPDVHRQVAAAGLAVYGQAPEHIRQAVLENILRGLQSGERGVAGDVVAAVRANITSLTPEFIWLLGDFLIDASWATGNTLSLTELSLFLWPAFQVEQRATLQPKLVEAVTMDTGSRVLRVIDRENKLILVCPYLPHEGRHRRACLDRRLLGED